MGGDVVKCRDLEVFSEEENQRDTFLIISQSCFQRKNHLSAQGISLFIDCLRCSGPKSYTQASISAHIVRLFFHCASAYVVFKKKINISNIYLKVPEVVLLLDLRHFYTYEYWKKTFLFRT